MISQQFDHNLASQQMLVAVEVVEVDKVVANRLCDFVSDASVK